jgi:hypothetical protein
VLLFALGRQIVGRRWAATAMAGLYVGFRAVLWLVLTATSFPPSAVPFFLLGAGVAIDLVFVLPMSKWLRPVVGAIAVTAITYGLLFVQSLLLAAPPRADWAAPISAAVLAVLWLAATAIAPRVALSATPNASREQTLKA